MKIAVVGCAGRMGRMLVHEVATTPGCALAGGTDRADSPFLGQDPAVLAGLEPSGLAVTADARAVFEAADAVIDFTTPAASVAHARLAAEVGTALIIGTTGMDKEHAAAIAAAAGSTPIVMAPNFSVGVNLLFALTELVASKLGIDYDIEIVEMHHRHKVDAPSGTALGIGRAAARGRGVALDDAAVMSREGITGPRPAGTIGFATLRGGDVVGDHSVIFAADGERLELTHKASSRGVFSKGAVRAALWTEGRAPGLYDMADVLGFGG
ncbi:4-hydroxy-tetrahydrodipicolinate reductase [Novispirillum sp. DQ9]|uniref:4-hydroxy-tetrahydrodipicolinate reductase n=1 Tax=Novispirillum sp. DQ9 TaxID=3398612 RepID=UPI003C7B27EF